MSYKFGSRTIGGNPDDGAMLGRELHDMILALQKEEAVILSIEPHKIYRAWSFKQQKYVEDLEYIIVYQYK